MLKKKYIWLVLCILFTMFIFCRSLKPAPASAQESSFVSQWLASIMRNFVKMPYDELLNLCTYIVRKCAHVAEFTLQSWLICGFFECTKGKIRKNVSWILFTGLFTACMDEAIQLFVEGRAGMISDVFVDFTGTVTGLIISVVFVWITRKNPRRNLSAKY